MQIGVPERIDPHHLLEFLRLDVSSSSFRHLEYGCQSFRFWSVIRKVDGMRLVDPSVGKEEVEVVLFLQYSVKKRGDSTRRCGIRFNRSNLTSASVYFTLG